MHATYSLFLLAFLHYAVATEPRAPQQATTVIETVEVTVWTTISKPQPTTKRKTTASHGESFQRRSSTTFNTYQTRPHSRHTKASGTVSTLQTRSSSSTSSTLLQTPKSSPTPARHVDKRGLSYNDPTLTNTFTSPRITWTYNWASAPYWGDYPSSTYNEGLAFIPMLWNNDPALTSIWNANVRKALNQYGADSVLAFNEPDGCCSSCGMSCISPSAAASAYKEWIQPFQGKLALGAPAVTNGVGQDIGMNWLESFLTACTSCTVDFIPVHWYGSVIDPDAFKAYVKQFHQRFQKPLWITEFGTSSGTEAQILTFLRDVLPWLDEQHYVQRYSYFMDRAAGAPFLLDTDGSMTRIGKLYNNRR